MATETRDFSFIERFDERLVPLPFGASDWVDPDVFRPVGGTEKPFDAGYIGFWGAVKRHHALFRALRRLQRPDFRVALIGGAWEGTAEEVAALADSYGVRGQLTFFERLAPSEVSEVIGQCKVSLLLSRKEGSNRGLFESMFAGTPALLLRENLGVRQSYVNAQTGRIVPERELPEALLWFRKHWQEYRPREWALEHISPLATTRKLNDYLRRSAASLGEPWTTDCVPKTNRPEVTYLHAGDRDRMPTVRDVMATYRRSA
jgi:glycosyltransferase involved in cell wall biosynthesis